MDIIDKIIASGNSEAAISEVLENKDFFLEVYEYFQEFYDEVKKEFSNNRPHEFPTDYSIFGWLASSERAKYFAQKRLEKSRDDLIVNLFFKHGSFWVVLSDYVKKHEDIFQNTNEDKFISAYRCWILCYILSYNVPCHFNVLLMLAKPDKDAAFLKSFLLIGAKKTCSNELGWDIDKFLVGEMFFLWSECDKNTQTSLRKILKKCKNKKHPSIECLLYKAKIRNHIFIPNWLFAVLLSACVAGFIYILMLFNP